MFLSVIRQSFFFSDVNDSPPRFDATVYNVTVAENTLPEHLFKLHAEDRDTTSNGELIYRLRDDHDGLFHLDPRTGTLTLTRALDYEFQRFYSLIADVFDGEINPLSDSCTISIEVQDQNDHAPSIQMKFNSIFLQNRERTMAFINESFDIRLPIAFVSVDDRDSGENGRVRTIHLSMTNCLSRRLFRLN